MNKKINRAKSGGQQSSKKTVATAEEMAGQEIDRLSDRSATSEQRASRKRRLLKGPMEFRDIRDSLVTARLSARTNAAPN